MSRVHGMGTLRTPHDKHGGRQRGPFQRSVLGKQRQVQWGGVLVGKELSNRFGGFHLQL